MKTKKKSEEFYVTLGERIIAAGIIGNRDLTKIISEVNEQYGYKAISYNSVYSYYSTLCNVYGTENFERTRILTGKREETTCYNLKKIDRTKISNFLNRKGKKLRVISEEKPYNGVVTKQDEAYRDAVLEEAKEHSELPKEKAVRRAARGLRRLDKDMIEEIKRLIPYYKKGRVLVRSIGEVVELKKITHTFNRYKVDLGIEIVDKESIKFTRSREEVIKEVSNLAWDLLKMKISITSNKPSVIDNELTSNESYIVLVIGGLIMKNNGKKIESYQVVGALKNNHYRPLDVNQMQLERIIKKVPNLLEKVGTGGINFVGDDRNETWKNIQELYSPSKQEWIIPWCVNSNLSFEEVQNVFPESWIEGNDVEVGSKIYMIKLDKSIKSFMKLALLSLKFRSIDFPIGETDLTKRLRNEIAYLNETFMSHLLTTVEHDWANKNTDKLLFQIEEGRI